MRTADTHTRLVTGTVAGDNRHNTSDGDIILIGSEDRLIGKVSNGDLILIGSED